MVVTLEADEQHRVLLAVTLSGRTLTPVEGFEQQAGLTLLEELGAAGPGLTLPAEIDRALARACWQRAEEPLARFSPKDPWLVTSPEDEAELLDRIRNADAGDVVDGDEHLSKLRSSL